MIDQLLIRLRRTLTSAPQRSNQRPRLRIGPVEQLEPRAMMAALSSFSQLPAVKLASPADANAPHMVALTALRSSSEQTFHAQPNALASALPTSTAATPILGSTSEPAPAFRVRDMTFSTAPASDLLPLAGLPAASLSIKPATFYLRATGESDSATLGNVISVFPGANLAAVRPLPIWQAEDLPWQRPILTITPGNLQNIEIADGFIGRIIIGRPEPLNPQEGSSPDVDPPSTSGSDWTRPASASSLVTDLVFATSLDWLSINSSVEGRSELRRHRTAARLALPLAGDAPADSLQHLMESPDAGRLQSLEGPTTDDDSPDSLSPDDQDVFDAKDSRQSTSPISHHDLRDDRSRPTGAAATLVEAAPGFGIHRLSLESLLSIIALEAEALAAGGSLEQLGFIEIANTGWIEPGPHVDAPFPSSAMVFGVVDAPLRSIMDCNFTVECSSDSSHGASPEAPTGQLQVAEFKVETTFE